MKAHNDAAVSALQAAWAAGRTYRVGEVPNKPVTPYNVVSVSAGGPRNYRVGSVHTAKFFRLSVQSVGATYNEAAFAVEKAALAFLDRRLTVSGQDCTPARLESPANVQRDPDGGVLMYALSTYTFTSSPA